MRRALGRGLSQLITEQFEGNPTELKLDAIVPNQRQPRQHFDPIAINELAESIREHGVLQPIVVRPISEGRYEIIAGERRYRASKLAGLVSVPVTVRAAAGQEALEIAIVENVQRADITPIEAAKAYHRLNSEFGMTQEQIAQRVGKSRASVANAIRLLKLSKKAVAALEQGDISEGHAKLLLSLDTPSEQDRVLEIVLRNELTVREMERLLAKGSSPTKEKPVRFEKDIYTKQLENVLSERLGSPSRIERKGDGGILQINFFSEDDLGRILETLGVEL